MATITVTKVEEFAGATGRGNTDALNDWMKKNAGTIAPIVYPMMNDKGVVCYSVVWHENVEVDE